MQRSLSASKRVSYVSRTFTFFLHMFYSKHLAKMLSYRPKRVTDGHTDQDVNSKEEGEEEGEAWQLL